MRLSDALRQVWPAFVLVTGLLLVGLAAHAGGLFVQAGALLERVPGSTLVLLLASMLLVAVVTAILNLDTAVVFLTPVLIHAARKRGVDEEPFLFSAVFMANASSLYLPGSNLTNLLVLAREPVAGGTFAARMLAPALAATLATAAGILLVFRKQLRPGRPRGRTEAGASGPLALVSVLAAATLTVALRQPALPVLAIGLAAVTIELRRKRLSATQVLSAVGPAVLLGLFALSVALGVLARSWAGPAQLLHGIGTWETAGIGALGAVAINNLPASVLLSAQPLAHPRALLLGLALGPNLAVTGSLSAYLWFKAAGQLELRPSLVSFTKRGAFLAPLAIMTALTATSILMTPS
jgi:arsenical pump membrane protein